MTHKVPFTNEDDALLMKFIATYNPQTRGRLGIKLYDRLVGNAEGKWSFASRHPVQSWRERYKTNQRWFDAKILRYQKKHDISADASSRVTGQSPAGKILTSSPHTGPSRNSPPLAGGSGSKKRAREVNAADLSPDPGPTKKMRRANVTVQGSNLPPNSPLVEPKNKGKLRAELSSSPRYEEDRDLPVPGPDDYTGALSGESDQDVENQSDGRQSSSPLPPSSPIKKTRLKPSANTKSVSLSSWSPGRAGASTVPEEALASSSHQQQGRHRVHSSEHSATDTRLSAQPASEASGPGRKPVIAPLQLPQEPTPPHTSALSSPGSPLPHGHSHTTSNPPQSGNVHQPQRVASPKRRHPSSLKRRIVHEEEDDVFCTPPVQSPPSSPPPRAHARDAPRLVEGPYRSAYTRTNGGHWPAPREEVEANGNEWPPRSKRDAPMSSPERPTATDVDRASVQHIDLRVLHSRKSVGADSTTSLGSTSRTLEKKRPQQARAPRSSTPPNLSESNIDLRMLHSKKSVEAFPTDSTTSLGGTSRILGLKRLHQARAPKSSTPPNPSESNIDLRVLHSRKSVETFRAGSTTSLGNTSRILGKKRLHQARAPKSSTPPNLSESNKELVLALGLEEVYKRMAENHKFHVDVVRGVAARQRSLEHTDQVLRNMREAAEREYARLLKQEFGATLGTGENQTEESEEEEEGAENLRNEEHGRSAPSQPASPRSLPNLSRTDGAVYMEVDADATQELDKAPTKQSDSSLPGSPALLNNMEWTDDDDELLLDGDLVVHEELVRRKGLGSVKFRTAHLYSLLLDG